MSDEWILFILIWAGGVDPASKPREVQYPFFATKAECMKGGEKYRRLIVRSDSYARVTVNCLPSKIITDVVKSIPPGTRREGWARTKEQRDAATPDLRQAIERPKKN